MSAIRSRRGSSARVDAENAWREPLAVIAWSEEAARVDRRLLAARASGEWWDVLAELDVTLLVTREYEHLVLALSATDGQPHLTHMALPHPSGLCFDAERGVVHVAATRNPNQLVTLAPASGADRPAAGDPPGRPLLPLRSRFLPGALYLHDLAMIGGHLHGNAVGQNAVVRFDRDGSPRRVWWPRCIEGPEGADFSRNYIQLNSIAAGATLARSYFTASSTERASRRPGHRNYPVDRRGVVFSGATREPIATGLTRPHSARLHDDRVWVDDSGYGELGVVEGSELVPFKRLPGWTRGLCFVGDIAFVGTSRVIPRFRQYAPGLDVARSVCALHAVDTRSGEVRGSLRWPAGNQIFAVEAVPSAFTGGFPTASVGRVAKDRLTRLFYSFQFDKGDTT